jgi:eukaryotic-like serine/threonine-protein kinase
MGIAESRCPRCGAIVSADAPERLCPKCLMTEALREESRPSEDGGSLSGPSTLSQPLAGSEARLSLKADQSFGPYRLVRGVGSGGFGEVWEAESLVPGRHVALKILSQVRSSSPEAMRRFEREGRLAASLNHPRCVFVFRAERIEGWPVISMELMPGGTLQDLIHDRGALPYREAVDHVLDVVAGLEAAQQAGILHRDVKPSNCFLDGEGRTKIGDFGLSKTFEEDEVALSGSGTFLGTPSYASPEQVRGGELDSRSDIYSVGATLYALLAGRAPFRGRRAPEVLAKILSDQPPALATQAVNVPAALERVVRRAMAKSPESRYRSYASLSAALMPFSSRGLTAGDLVRRAAAYGIDAVLLNVLSILGLGLLGLPTAGLPQYSALAALALTYFGLMEALVGQSLGKRLFGLRVTSEGDEPARLRQILVRTSVFVGLAFASELPVYWQAPPARAVGLSLPSLLAYMLIRGAPVATMRRGNAYAGIHELLSGTRVRAVVGQERIAVPTLAPEARGEPTTTAPRRFGPYLESHPLWRTSTEALLVAWDPVLRRNTWIHSFAAAEAAPTPAELARSCRHRLRWLEGSRSGEEHWDAYEAPRGASLLAWVAHRGRLSWPEARRLLQGVAHGISELGSERSRLRPLSLAHVWVDTSGWPKLLDFAAVPPDEAGGASPGPGARLLLPAEEWPDFLRQLVVFTLEGRVVPGEAGPAPRVRLPESVRLLLSRLFGQEAAFDSLPEVLKALAALPAGPARVSRSRRLATLALPAVFVGTLVAGALVYVLSARPAGGVERPHVVEARASGRPAIRVALDAAFFSLVPWGFPALLLAVLLRGGLSFSVAGIRVEQGNGSRAGRGRCLLRALVAWSPLLVGLAVDRLAGTTDHGVVRALALLGIVAGSAWAVLSPERSLQDRVVGTYLTPR